MPQEGPGEYGPGGYLPDRAARRARKIVLREPMSLGWPIAAGVAALVLVVVGGGYLLVTSGPPGPPAQPVGSIAQVDPRGVAVLEADGAAVLVVRGGGGVQAFRAPGTEVAWCEESRLIEAAGGQAWTLEGALVAGSGESLTPVAAEVFDGRLYVDLTVNLALAPPRPGEREPACS